MNRFVIAEPKLCIGCNTCMAACSVAHEAEGLQSHPRLTVVRSGTISAPIACRHCEDAPCAKVCPVNAITLTGRSVVLNEVTCIGCKLCAVACPFGVIEPSGTSILGVATTHNQLSYASDGDERPAGLDPILSWSKGVRSVAVKCDLCEFDEQGPACVRACPTDALFLVDDQAMDKSNEAKRVASINAASAVAPFIGNATEQKT